MSHEETGPGTDVGIGRLDQQPAPGASTATDDSIARMKAAQSRLRSLVPDQDLPEALRLLLPIVDDASQPMCIVWGSERLLFCNEACRKLTLPDPSRGDGLPFHEVWTDLKEELASAIAQSFRGEPARIDNVRLARRQQGRADHVHLAFSFTPVRDAGDVVGAFGVCDDLTPHVREAAHAQFRTDLVDRLRELDSVDEAMSMAAERLGHHLGVQGVGYADVPADGDLATITHDWAVHGSGRFAGAHRLSALGPMTMTELRAGKAVRIESVDAQATTPGLVALRERIGARALVIAPAAKHGRLSGALFVFSNEPRKWTNAEVTLIAEITKRLWAVLHRIRVDAALKDSEARFRSVFENAAVGSGYSAPDGRFLMVNEQLCQITGYRRSELLRMRFQDVTYPDDIEADISHLQRLKDGEAENYTREKRYVRKDGEILWVSVSIGCVRGSDGEVRHFVGFVKDINETKKAQDALRESERKVQEQREFLEAVIEAAPVGISIARDPLGEPPIINEVARRLTGIDEFKGDLERYDNLGAIHRDGRRYEADDYPNARALKYGEEVSDGEMIYRRGDESRRWLINSRPLRDAGGEIIAAVTAFADVEEQRKGEEHRKLLIAELNHRVKNTLAVVQAIVQQTFRDGAPPDEARTSLQGRLTALAATHDLLTRESWEKATLEQLAAGALDSRGVDEERVSYGGPHVVLQPKQAVTIAMALHELRTNAMKYGALSNDTGTIAVEWSVSDDPQPQLRLVWRERGGPEVSPPERRGFGSRMIERGLAAELKGEVAMQFQSEGFVCVIEAPMPEGQGEPA